MSQDRDRDDLEERVAELGATVDGLTDELVDAKERIRDLETEVGLREDEDDEELDEDMTVEELFEEAEADPIAEEHADTDQENIGDDIIVG